MKISFPENYKTFFTLEDVDNCNTIKKSDSKPTSDDVLILARAFAHDADILKTSAEFAKNSRAYDVFGQSGNMDIWITVHFFSEFENTFYIIGAYISDVWTISTNYMEELKPHMYIRTFTEK